MRDIIATLSVTVGREAFFLSLRDGGKLVGNDGDRVSDPATLAKRLRMVRAKNPGSVPSGRRTFYVTTPEGNAKGLMVVHKFSPLSIVTTYCCHEPSEYTRNYSNVVVRVEADSRRSAKAQVPGAIRVRSEVPAGGWESLGRDTVYVQNC
jgi:hypothetical protein